MAETSVGRDAVAAGEEEVEGVVAHFALAFASASPILDKVGRWSRIGQWERME